MSSVISQHDRCAGTSCPARLVDHVRRILDGVGEPSDHRALVSSTRNVSSMLLRSSSSVPQYHHQGAYHVGRETGQVRSSIRYPPVSVKTGQMQPSGWGLIMASAASTPHPPRLGPDLEVVSHTHQLPSLTSVRLVHAMAIIDAYVARQGEANLSWRRMTTASAGRFRCVVKSGRSTRQHARQLESTYLRSIGDVLRRGSVRSRIPSVVAPFGR